MARQRREPPKTPFGAWLGKWLDDHPAVTNSAFAQDVGVSKGLITQWIGGTVPKGPALKRIAERTNEPIDNLEHLLYGSGTRRAEEPGRYSFSPEELEALLQRAAATAIRQVLDEREGDRGA